MCLSVVAPTMVAPAQTDCPNEKHSCYVTGGPGCSDEACCSSVCEVDPFCCVAGWDFLCVQEAFELCSACGDAKAGSCCSPYSFTPGCDNAECCQCVCMIDPTCCDVEWDALCVDLGGDECFDPCGCEKYPNCPNPEHDCYTVGDPGCDNKECCILVCAVDGFCCEVVFDAICALEAAQVCGNCGGDDAGPCCEPNGTVGCEDSQCCSCVCIQDAFCCDVAWDELCVAIGDDACFNPCGCDLFPFCPNPEHSCYVVGSLGCDNEACCELVCAFDPFCCEDTFDSLCVAEALDLCTGCGEAKAGSCCASHAPGCDNPVCCACVCEIDPSCCDVEWDALCVDLGGLECVDACGCQKYPNCPNPEHSCYVTGPPGCDNKECCLLLCAEDPFCCELVFDNVCAQLASIICAGCGEPEAGDCCEANDSPGCAIDDCCQQICQTDAFCCDTQWDQLCVDEAWNEPDCECSFCPNDDHNCFTAGTPGCSEEFCCTEVCEHDPVCCETAWDDLCVAEAVKLCSNCGEPGSGSCFDHDNTPACNDAACCGAVCALDAYCCEVQWDNLCVDEAIDLCTCEFIGDVSCDDQVGPADLAMLLASWNSPGIAGVCGCSSDLDGDGDVGPADLAELLAGWGGSP